MAVRRVTRKYDSVIEFLEDREGIFGQGMVLMPAESVRGELAPELKLDLLIPPLGRLGPIPAQVVNRDKDGNVGLHLPEIPDTIQQRLDELDVAIAQLRDWFLARGELVAAGASAASQALGQPSQAVAQAVPAASGRAARGFPVPDLSSVEPDLRGTCAEREFRTLLVELAARRATGLLTIRGRGGRIRYGFWSNGGPVGFRSEPLQEGEVLGVLLYKADQITKAQLQESLAIMQQEGCRQGEAFIQLGIMTFPQLVMVLGKQVEFVLQRVLGETDGEWTFHELDALPERFLPSPLKAPGLVFRNLVKQARAMKGETIYEALGPYLDKYVSLPPRLAEIAPEMGFGVSEARLVGTIQESSWRMRELYAVSPMSRAVTAAVMWAFLELGFVEFNEHADDARTFAALRVIIDRKKNQIFKGSHFDVLEVHWICVGEEVEQAYQRLKKEYKPSRYARMDDADRADVDKINVALDAAREALLDDRARREYRKSVIEESKIVQSAELLGKQGDMAVLRNDRRAALTCFSKAAELIPGRPEFRQALMQARNLSG
ncbi:MAG: hypothetical protein H6742_11190 [Alphaproteobacteria bacterium]|nr:hypothetical protein [Alphaproteobacteria bacterium]